jgi:DNA-binding IscR family transcriptional regulator
MAGSIGVNPVIVRNVIGLLRKAKLLQTQQGVPGARLAQSMEDVTLLDVYQAVRDDGKLFSIHDRPNPECSVGRNIQSTLETFFGEAQKAMEDRLSRTTLRQVIELNQLERDG